MREAATNLHTHAAAEHTKHAPQSSYVSERDIKRLARVVAFDDGYFRPRTKGSTKLVGVVYRFDSRVEGIISGSIRVDGHDSTKKIISMLKKSRFLQQVAFILLAGVNFAGFNIADVNQLNKKLGKPVIMVFRRKPRFHKIRAALRKFHDSRKRIALIENAGKVYNAENVHFQCIGTTPAVARHVIKKCLMHSNIPEPLRLAHLIASGVTLGESTRP